MFQEIGRVLRSRTKLDILKSLYEERTPTMIAKRMDTHITSASRSMIKLEKDGLIRCLNSSQPNFRFYRITRKGKRILEKIESLKKP